jgi:hypothetical protein
MNILRIVVLAFAGLATSTPLHAAPTDAQTSELNSQAEALSKKLDQLPNAPSIQKQMTLASQHWAQMQDYMRLFPSMGCPMCGTMMGGMMMSGPGMHGGAMSGGMMHGPGMQGGMMGGNMMGCPMMGGVGSNWPMPNGMSPDAYRSGMAAQMKAMRDRIAMARATTDPVERERLLRDAWEGMYRNMQTMRGMGWMWTPPEQARAALPDASSQEARLVGIYCSQCHAAPSPSLHSATEWSEVASRMRGHMRDADSAGQGVKIPNEREFSWIIEYLGKHGR